MISKFIKNWLFDQLLHLASRLLVVCIGVDACVPATYGWLNPAMDGHSIQEGIAILPSSFISYFDDLCLENTRSIRVVCVLTFKFRLTFDNTPF